MNMDAFLNPDPGIKLIIKSLKDGVTRTGPLAIRVGISKSCNFNCVTCWHNSPLLKKPKPREWKRIKINKDLLLNTLEEVAEMGCRTVLFSGSGEPFTHPNMMDFLKKTKEKKMLVRIQTNLSLVDDPRLLNKCLCDEKDIISVNLMAATSKTYVKMHPNQKEEMFYSILDKIKILKKGKARVRLIYIVNKLNYHEISDAFKLTKKLKTILHLEGMDFSLEGGIGNLALDNEAKKEVIRNLSRLKKNRNNCLISNITDYINQLKYSGLGIKNLDHCCIGFLFSVINEEGNVTCCYNGSKKFLMGNIKERSFKKIWYSKKYQVFRTKLLKKIFLKECRECIQKRNFNFKIRKLINPGLVRHTS